jgi:hypothetical protein
MGEEMEDVGDVENDGISSEPHPLPPGHTLHSEDSQGFVPLSSVDLEGGEESRGSGSGVGSGDPWARISELPRALREKMMELKNEKLVLFNKYIHP